MSIGIGLRMVSTPRYVENRILESIQETLNEALLKSEPLIRSAAVVMIKEAIQNCEEYQSIVSGILRGELGIVNSKSKMEQLLDIWIKSVNLQMTTIRKRGSGVTGRIRLTAINADFQDVLSTSIGYYDTEKDVTIPWLEWMLKYGDQVIIRDYYVVRNPLFSRTGTVVMKKSGGRSWQVPPQYSGTIRNNFVTRATDSILENLADMMIEQLNKQI